MSSTYQETLDFLYAQLPMYQRIGSAAYKADLNNTIALCSYIGNPQNKLKTIHIAGTNGKGSTSHIIAGILQHHGYRVGLYTSPHLTEFTERIKINGKEIDNQSVIQFTERIKPILSEIKPSFFEITVAMAFDYFDKEKVDVAVIETGLGGRLDSTNIIRPWVSVITSISMDHTDLLGNTIPLIAAEKAGIIKENTPVVVGKLAAEALEVIKSVAKAKNAPLIEISVPETSYNTDLKGDFQQHNIILSLTALEAIQTHLPTNISKTTEALTQISTLTNFLGRWQTLQQHPLIICDVGHNEEGIKVVVRELKKIPKKQFLVLGFVKGKDLDKIAPLFPKEATYYFVTPSIDRGLSCEITAEHFAKCGITGLAAGSIERAFEQIKLHPECTQECFIFVGGSNFVVSDLLALHSLKKPLVAL